jgi:hypothetical protein
MPKLIPFPASDVQTFAERLLILSASCDQLRKPEPWANRPAPPEALGNMLQRLALRRPLLVLVLENIVADVLAHADL